MRLKTAFYSCFLLAACSRNPAPPGSGPVTVEYWAGWTGFEGDAIKTMVQAFNGSHPNIHVNLLAVSQIEEKLLVATAGGNPPDLAGLYSRQIPQYGHAGALTDLDTYIFKAELDTGIYTPAFLDLGKLEGRTLALPLTGVTLALHWNKAMFKAAGLDPEKPPRSLKELDAFSEKLTRRDKQGRILQAGFLPTEPGWWIEAWPYYFGGNYLDERGGLTLDSPEVVRAYAWAQGYARRYGGLQLTNFQSGFGNFASPQNAFLSGKVAMVLQGVWMANFIQNYAPGMAWGAAPFPVEDPAKGFVSKVESDLLVLPKGARHPGEAWAFMEFMAKPENLERFNLLQRKVLPLRRASPDFLARHPNPQIKVFMDLSKGRTFRDPALDIWPEFMDQLASGFQELWLLRKKPEEVFPALQERFQPKLERELRRREKAKGSCAEGAATAKMPAQKEE